MLLLSTLYLSTLWEPCREIIAGGPCKRPVKKSSLNRNMIHSERVEAEGKITEERGRERDQQIEKQRKRENTATNGRKEGQVSVLIWPFSCSIVVFVLTTHKKKRIALS